MYGILIWCGVLLSVLAALLICRRKGTDRDEIVYSGIYVMVGAIVGAKLLFVLVSLPQMIAQRIHPLDLLWGGFVFYGGLIGGALGLLIYCKQFKMSASTLAETYATVLPLGHALGRVGCFCAGCCYGIEYDGPLCFTYRVSLADTPIGVPLLPVQLFEAVCLLIVFAVLLIVYLKSGKKIGKTLPLYLLLYSFLRFTLEFFRGDRARGILLLSTSQWICLFILGGLIIRHIWHKHIHKTNT
ncbi:MAG: prolipoprotein diacylglyceryl transferase [Clostridia bacterium]|nr:prolipoprotein diacylglyceryl transferase [Clostridia bacterium]